MRYWSQDESRMGLHTIQRKKLTGYGIKPQGKVQWDFTYVWLYGAVEPLTGASFFYEFTHLDTVCFEKFLELFASEYPEDLHIIQVDNGGFHNSLNLSIPENVILLFQPAYSPEVNQYGSVKSYAVLKTINTGGFIIIPVPLCLTCLERNFETGFFTTLGLFL